MKRLILIGALLFGAIMGIAQPQFIESYPDTLNKKRLHKVIGYGTATYLAGLAFLSFIWYEDQEPVPFHVYNDASGYLQVDKAGHAYSAYHISYTAYYALRWAGLDKKKALIYGGSAGFVFLIPVEIFDGAYDGWGFSWSDMAANALGSLLFVTQEALLNEQLIMMKFSYSPSIYPKYHSILGESQIESFFLDYNAHTYWLSLNISGLAGGRIKPRWLNLAFGYSANGMIKEFENPQFYQGEPFPYLERYRQFLISLDIDFSRIPTKKKWLRTTFRILNLFKVPFPALEFNRIDGMKFSLVYF